MKKEVSEADQQSLSEIKMLTDMVRSHQKGISECTRRRRGVILRLRRNGVTYNKIAEAMSVSEQNVYKIIRDDIPREPEYDADGNLIPRRGRPPKPKIIE
jgi:DNA invertase Pin-like site-specific DNA recombinase